MIIGNTVVKLVTKTKELFGKRNLENCISPHLCYNHFIKYYILIFNKDKIRGAKGFDRIVRYIGCVLRLSGGLIKNLAKQLNAEEPMAMAA